MVSVIIACFVIGYIMIVFEHPLRMDKTIPSLLMGMFCWTLIVVVRLSNTEDIKNANQAIIHKSLILLWVWIRLVMTENPLCRSTNSTMVMAPIRKIKISAIFPKWWSTSSLISCGPPAISGSMRFEDVLNLKYKVEVLLEKQKTKKQHQVK